MEAPVCVFAGEDEENELANFTPAFLWLLRDFYLTLEEDGRQARPCSPQCKWASKHLISASRQGMPRALAACFTRRSELRAYPRAVPAQLTPREYLETALRPVPGSGRAVEAKNAVRVLMYAGSWTDSP